MKISKRNRRDAKGLFQACVVNGLLDEDRARQAVDAVLASKPRGFIGILSHFQRLLKLDEARRTAKIESAFPMTPELETKLKGTLESRYGKGLRYTFQENPTLIGGVRI